MGTQKPVLHSFLEEKDIEAVWDHFGFYILKTNHVIPKYGRTRIKNIERQKKT